VPERSPDIVRPTFRDESDAHPKLSQMPIRETRRVCCPLGRPRVYRDRRVGLNRDAPCAGTRRRLHRRIRPTKRGDGRPIVDAVANLQDR